MSMKKSIRAKIKQHRDLIMVLVMGGIFVALMILSYHLGTLMPFTAEG